MNAEFVPVTETDTDASASVTLKNRTRRATSWPVTRTRTPKLVPEEEFVDAASVNVTKSRSMSAFMDSFVSATTLVAIEVKGKYVPDLTMVHVIVASASVTMTGQDRRVNAGTVMILALTLKVVKFVPDAENVTAESVVVTNLLKVTTQVINL